MFHLFNYKYLLQNIHLDRKNFKNERRENLKNKLNLKRHP